MSGEAGGGLFYPDSADEDEYEPDLDDGLYEDGFCISGCPDDVCRMSGHCAWRASGPAPEAAPVAAGQEE